ncbi:winged helix-turn-helix domain-containing protein [Erwinia tasmaniensis]|nr:winged helix-turn-helix domain-containing protein [Erwinia tasmaniensis]
MDDSKIYFLDFIFNPKTRTLQKNDIKVQLRKKQADVLNLLCTKYPEPVSREDFLAGVWNGGYVTTQSIAQVIRSLRLDLDDTNKKIIVTIPKLGYRFTVRPLYEDSTADNKENEDNCLKRGEYPHMVFNKSAEKGVTQELCDHTEKKNNILRMRKMSAKNATLVKKLFYSTALIAASLLLILLVKGGV